ncbi:hypothetical protein J2S48_001215 [Promicromonospora iranensis]|uniref:Uncharacterized protein n=1 Tax=Promicromonospora iranensis TaxID=1105144 RepID=A0ABU2CK46_9MICO|nr:hypothetical protein [Promicromonospora iranensis]
MPNFCVNKNAQPATRDHEIHNVDSQCRYLPAPANRTNLGSFASCSGAVAAAKQYYGDVNGCAHCATACHTS